MKAYSYSEARANLKSMLDSVTNDCDQALIHRREGDDVVVMSVSEFNSWQETLHLLSNPANAIHLNDSIAQLKAGEAKERELMKV
ncbi:type II toxin-antitoxin system Phd/YefM family antitoxin [Agarivorans sp. Toyoura001]|uniref:type II toxin-antitoxin system Phd/YefM family antitoxin n=1 Tax=unclassified Agarivorans TaxID=2636026 RepID=UPI0010D582FB|nr:type II toxin-antitoxin system prevent-host-death family antitoxin [Agarivorans sp. Toyoura001]GDY28002.1 antitoxin [Agarivorans sp. Toyoura001]